MVHEREAHRTCGPIMPQGGLQATEVMLYTVDIINSLNIMPKGLNIGVYILDDCDTDTYGLQQAVDFIKGSISNINDEDEYKCEDGSSPQIQNKVISGVVGASSSVTSIQVANLLKLFKIPQISFFSTSVCLAVKLKLTKDSGVADSKFYDDIVKELQMKSKAKGVIVFGSDQEVAELMKAVKRNNATGQFSWIGSDGWSARALTFGLRRCELGLKRIFGHFCSHLWNPSTTGLDFEAISLFHELSETLDDVLLDSNNLHNFSCATRSSPRCLLLIEGHEAEVEGTISVQPQANPVHGFEDYFLNLTVESNKRNPWFVEFWEDHFECRHTQGLETPYNIGYKRICNGKERLTRENTKFEAQLQFVSDAVMAFAYALRRMHEVTCGLNYVGLCAKMNPIDGEILLGYLRKVNFVGLSGDRFKFNEQGDGPARYNIIHYKQIEVGVYKWVTVGFF
ncbi:Metabotropic glutamate receptor 8,Metabotropic glutamate receptor 7,Metabotropic glutamate receptor 1 [Lepeophtheirus salmonis]|uniref:Metabotropic glutamate receptor 8,Metabotropic glutamate receptor 7,Metabotropic glutamate receptor 1 n=1 Tax=Lepeophtheirus salmonis TaxID=72036 RepID=A0A7R8D457_LEPSM|nr:Metabotropic glutamate receptor 8,Metabotropic glutamate receptor 7,Metabotropic glutamate receptor 1 [Lepeophtheirus salmonis]CAF2992471.1 Metabotropic glutamate receptor 8,Metabotropic glutamate receptor 7,Metabotropic glutamate receptor 1 [Lepeophtheirus salmonis]